MYKRCYKMIEDSELNEKQLIFAKEYLVCMNATQSAVKAGYSEKTAYSQGCRLLKNVKVKAYVDYHLKNRASKLDITPNKILEELGHIAFFNINNIFDGNSLKEVSELPDNVTRAISSIKSRMEKSGDGFAEVTEIKSNDKLRAIELLMKYLGMFATDNEQTKDEKTIIEII